MSRVKTLQDLFKRYRRPGDMVMAAGSFALALTLLMLLPYETVWVKKTKLFAQPIFWPAVSVGIMVVFSGLHFFGALVSERIPGRWQEVLYWLRSLEFAAWFMAYVLLVPVLGYLPATLILVPSLSWRMGYRSARMLGIGVLFAVLVVVTFKMVLSVKIPGGALYEHLPEALRGFFILNL